MENKKEKLRKLIENSHSLDEKNRNVYLAIIDFLKEERVNALLELFEEEAQMVEEAEAEFAKDSEELDREHVAAVDELVEKEVKKEINRQESAEKKDADRLLEKLN